MNQEFYDVFISDWDGNPTPTGQFVTIEAEFNNTAPYGGGLNIAKVDFNGTGKFATSVASFVALGDNAIPNEVGKAVDGSLLTDTTMGNTSGQTGHENGQRLRVTVGFPCPCIQPPSEMVAWWPLDETSGTTANDIAGFNNQGTHVNGPTPTAGMVAGALSFDGTADHVKVPDHPELNVRTDDFTIDAWVRTSQSSGVVVLVDKRSGSPPLGYSLYLVDGRLGFQMANGVGSSTCAPAPNGSAACVNYVSPAPPSGPNVADGHWHHVAAVVDRSDGTSGVRLYVDGVQVFTGAPLGANGYASPPDLPANLYNPSDLYLGMRTPGMGGGGFFPGDLDEVELFKRALSQQEIQAIYNADSAGKCKGRRWVLHLPLMLKQ